MWEEQPNAVKDSKVKGYIKKTECAACKAKREAEAKEAAAAEEDRKEKAALAEKRQAALNVIADAEIAKTGEVK